MPALIGSGRQGQAAMSAASSGAMLGFDRFGAPGLTRRSGNRSSGKPHGEMEFGECEVQRFCVACRVGADQHFDSSEDVGVRPAYPTPREQLVSLVQQLTGRRWIPLR